MNQKTKASPRDLELGRDNFIGRASPADAVETESITDAIKENAFGKKTRYEFSCRDCNHRVITKNEYTHTESRVVDEFKYYTLGRLWRNLRYSIPFLSAILPRSLDYGGSDKDEGAREAFEEVKNQFVQCEYCGEYTCRSCYNGGRHKKECRYG
mgnify:CR=1 FL=1